MRKIHVPAKLRPRETQVPVFIEKDEDGFYVVECPLFEGWYSQGKTVDEALRNIREVIHLIAEEKNREFVPPRMLGYRQKVSHEQYLKS